MKNALRLGVAIAALSSIGLHGQMPDEGSRMETTATPGVYKFTWQSQLDRTYFIQTSEDLLSPWTYIPAIEVGDGTRLEYGIETESLRFFYRLRYTDEPTSDPYTDDFDGDGVNNWAELQQGSDPFSAVSNDGDAVPDDWELFYYGNYTTITSAYADANGTSWNNIAKLNLGLDPRETAAPVLTGAEIGNEPTTVWPGENTDLVRSASNPRLDAEDNELLVGSTPGSLAVDASGSATYTIPLDLPPGTNGVQPTLALKYSSASPNGLMGMGWMLEGLSVITRGSSDKNLYPVNETTSDPADLQNDDRFYLDGQRLIGIAGTYGAANSEYRTEAESFSKVVGRGQTGTSTFVAPTWFEVWTKSGLRLEYGNTTDSRPTNTAAVLWLLNKVEDRNGNFYTITYETHPNSLAPRPASIEYTGNTGMAPYNTVQFNYENRPDAVLGYSTGWPFLLTQRLRRIDIKHSGENVRQYHLSYDTHDYSNNSRLREVQEEGLNGKRLPATSFEWSEGAFGYTAGASGTYAGTSDSEGPWALNIAPQTQFNNYSRGTHFGDFNGDGLTDFAEVNDSRIGGNVSNPSRWAKIHLGRGDSFEHVATVTLNQTATRHLHSFSVGDLNGDGLSDLLVQYRSAFISSSNRSATMWTDSYLASVGTSPEVSFTIKSLPDQTGQYIGAASIGYSLPFTTTLVDFSRSGQAHVLLVNNGTSSTSWRLYRYNNDTGAYVTAYTGANGQLGTYMTFQGFEYNGDGVSDLFTRINDPDPAYQGWGILSFTKGAYGWIPGTPTTLFSSAYNLHTGDFNGDGLSDFLILPPRNGSLTSTGADVLAGYGFGFHTVIARSDVDAQRLAYRTVDVQDFNHDGRDDLMVRTLAPYTPTIPAMSGPELWLSDTNSSGAPIFRQISLPVGSAAPTPFEYVYPITFNRDALRDLFLVGRQPNGQISWRVLTANSPSKTPDLITKVTDGLGASATITYNTLLEEDVYTKGGASAGLVTVKTPTIVVGSISHDNGPAYADAEATAPTPSTYTETYRYEGLRAQPIRGPAGFAAQEVTDSRTGITTRVERSQTFPYVGFVTRTTTKRGSIVLSDTVNTPNVRWLRWGNTNDRTYFTYSSPVVNTTADIATDSNASDKLAASGTGVLSTITVTQTYDDYGNPLVTTTNYGFGGRTTTRTIVYFAADAANWLIARPQTDTTVATATGQPTITRSVAYTYKPSGNRLRFETVTTDGADTAVRLVTTFTDYDSFGNVRTTSTVGRKDSSTDQTRTQTVLWDTQGRFPTLLRNALNHEQTPVFDSQLGTLNTFTDANNLQTTFGRDAFGRVISITYPDTSIETRSLRWLVGDEGFALETKHTSASGTQHSGPPSLTVFDRQARAVRSATINADGVVVWQEVRHDARGLAILRSLPYANGTSPALWHTTTHDGLGRAWRHLTPNAVQSETTYAGLTTDQVTTATHESTSLTRHTRRTVDPLGQLLTLVQNPTLGTGHVEYSAVSTSYDALGQIAITTNPGGSQITTETEATRGVRTAVTDPNTGRWTYKTNAFGEVFEQTDAKLQVTRFTFDVLGRLLTRTEDATGSSPLLTTWTYDTAPGKGVGALASVTAADGAGGTTTETYAYDSLGRPIRSEQLIAGTNYVSEITQYNSVSAPVAARLAVGPVATPSVAFDYTTHYNAFGFPREVRAVAANGLPETRLWSLQEVNTYGQPTLDFTGSGLTRRRVFDPADGGLREVKTGRADGRIHSLRYTPDPLGNLLERAELHAKTGSVLQAETFAYDSLDRLTTGATYDQTGNITLRDGVSYAYAGPRPHAATAVGATTYQYDANGQLLSRDSVTEFAYAPFNQPSSISRNGFVATFRYGADRQRIEQVIDGRTIRYAGAQIEQVIPPPPVGGEPAQPTETKFTLFVGGGRLVQVTFKTGAAEPTFVYLLDDKLGSVDAITDSLGKLSERLSFDAWGRRRDAADWADPAPARTTDVERGYTDHEGLDALGLIHMNGRLFDSAIGRFLSPDPVVQSPYLGQNRNRYSYVLNNPLKYTDPSGYQFVYGGGGGNYAGLNPYAGSGGSGSFSYNVGFAGSGMSSGLGAGFGFRPVLGGGTLSFSGQNASAGMAQLASGPSGSVGGLQMANRLFSGNVAALVIRSQEMYNNLAVLKAQGAPKYSNVELIKGFTKTGEPSGTWAVALHAAAYKSRSGNVYGAAKLAGTDAIWFFNNDEAAKIVKNENDAFLWIAIGGQVSSTVLSAGTAGFGGAGMGTSLPTARIFTSSAPATSQFIPRGFSNAAQFNQAAAELDEVLLLSGITDAKIGVRGSSITGYSARTGAPFRAASDIDFFVESAQLTNGFSASKSIPGFVHPDKIMRAFPRLEGWSTRWSVTIGRDITPGAFMPGTLSEMPLPQPILWIK
jgi:RHS repeat-associated protein